MCMKTYSKAGKCFKLNKSTADCTLIVSQPFQLMSINSGQNKKFLYYSQ